MKKNARSKSRAGLAFGAVGLGLMVGSALPAAAMPAIELELTLSTDGQCGPSGQNDIMVEPGTSVDFCWTMTNDSGNEVTFHTMKSNPTFGTYFTNDGTVVDNGDTYVVLDSDVISADRTEVAEWQAFDQGNVQYDATATATIRVCPTASIVYVRESAAPGGTGLSWATAYQDLQDGLQHAEACAAANEIRIADGTYVPDRGTGDQSMSFEILESVAIVGAYAPGGSAMPDPSVHETVLSGDLDGNDNGFVFPLEPTRSDNARTVISLQLPNGLLSPNGNAMSLSHLTVSGGTNPASVGQLATAIEFDAFSSEVLVRNVTVEQNAGAPPTVRQAAGHVTIVDSVFRDNWSNFDGVFRTPARVNTTTSFVGVLFQNNVCITCPTLAVLNDEVEVIDSAFVWNFSTTGGGAIETRTPYASVTVTNSTIAGNNHDSAAAIIGGGGSVTVRNSIVWDNSGGAVSVTNPTTVTITSSDIEGGFAGSGNLDVDPMFINATGGDFTLGDLSPAKNVGDDSLIPADTADLDNDGNTTEQLPVDLAGETRVQQGRVDMGAFETEPLDPRGFVTLPTPCVAYDSTSATVSTLDDPLNGLELRTITLTGVIPQGQTGAPGVTCIPSGVTAAAVTITATNPSVPGNLRLSASGIAPEGGVVNYTNNGLSNSNTVTTEISLSGEVDLFANSPLANGVPATDVRIAVLGYYPDTGGDEYVGVTPCAVADSRLSQGSTGVFSGPFAANSPYPDIDVVGSFSATQGSNGVTDCGVPAAATSVVVNVVAVGGTGGSGYLSVGPGGIDPFELQVNFVPIGLNNAVQMIVPMNGGQTIAVDVDSAFIASTHVRLVVVGYYVSNGGANYTPINPCAVFDSRFGAGAFGGKRDGNSTTTYQVTGGGLAAQGGLDDCGIPAGATAVQINNVAIAADLNGNFQAFATGSSPTGGILNFASLLPAATNSNAIPIPLSSSGQMDLFTNTGGITGTSAVHARGVVLGYYTN